MTTKIAVAWMVGWIISFPVAAWLLIMGLRMSANHELLASARSIGDFELLAAAGIALMIVATMSTHLRPACRVVRGWLDTKVSDECVRPARLQRLFGAPSPLEETAEVAKRLQLERTLRGED